MAAEDVKEFDVLPLSLLRPFHEVPKLTWNEASGTGRIEALRRNRLDDWYYGCHFVGDPVMPGCWGVDAVWQCLRLFAAERGLKACDKPIGMEDVRFFGQIRPYDGLVKYEVDILSLEESDGQHLLTGKAQVSVDGKPVYAIGSAQVGSAYWESEPCQAPALPAAPPAAPARRLSLAEFSAKDRLSQVELIGLSQGTLVDGAGTEVGLLPASLMLELGEVRQISYDAAADEGRVLATRGNGPDDWFYSMNAGLKPAALSIDALWQMLGLFLAWRGNPGTGRALGFEKVEIYDAVTPKDRQLVYDVRVLRTSRTEENGDAFARADARVFADGRPILSVTNAKVGCHKDIRYSNYPLPGPRSTGG